MLTRPSRAQRVLNYSLVAVLAVFILFPVYYMAIISLKTPRAIYREPSLLPDGATLQNYAQLFGEMDFLINFRNSLLVATLATVISVFIAVLAAYSLVRLKYRFRDAVGRLILLTYLTPAALLFIALSVIMARIGLTNTLQGLMFVYLTFATPLSTWLLMGFFRGIPPDLEEQAMVDGATRLQSLRLILLPLSAPGIVAVTVLTFTSAWNELLYALILITSPDLRTVPLALNYFITGDVFRWGLIMAGAVAAAVPVMVLYYLAQRFMVQGLATGGVKG